MSDETLLEVHADELKEQKKTPWVVAFGIIAFLFAAFQIYTAGAGPYIALVQRSVHVCFAMVVCTLAYRMKKSSAGPQPLAAYLLDLLEILASVAITVYMVMSVERLVLNIGFATPTATDTVLGYFMVVLVINATRKAIGWTFTGVAIVSLAYALVGPWMPGLLSHGGLFPNEIAATLLVNPLGIYGVITGTSANIIAIYVIFGAVMLSTGAAKGFLNIAMVMAGRLTGGGAQVAAVSSAMLGMVNGSAVANVATTGSFTIPMMKSRGYPPHFAGGVEAAASAGGQITPPIMGAGAFVMAEILGIPYITIAKMAAIPALLYYVAIMMIIYFEAKKRKLPPLNREDIPRLRTYRKELALLLIPVAVLAYLIVQRYTPRLAAFWAIVLNMGMFIAVMLPVGRACTGRRLVASVRESGSKILDGVIEGASTAATLGVLVAGAQIIVWVLGATGLALKLSQWVMGLGVKALLPYLLISMLICLVLGMGIPTVPSYIITAAVAAPLLEGFGIKPVVIHLFVFYFAIMSGLTPPVCAAAYAASVIAKANMFKTAFEAIKLAAVGFLVPFVFIYNPDLLGFGGPWRTLQALGTGALGTLLLSTAIAGYWNRPLNLLQRVLSGLGGVMAIIPGNRTDLVGLVMAAFALFVLNRKRLPEPVVAGVPAVEGAMAPGEWRPPDREVGRDG